MNHTSKSLHSFTNKLIDYAGLFPPAKLDLRSAFNNFVMYNKGEYSGMLSKFICPASMLQELDGLIRDYDNVEFEFHVSAITGSGKTVDEFKQNFINDLSLIKNFNSSTENVIVKTFEFKIPDELNDSNNTVDIASFLDEVTEGVNRILTVPSFAFVEGQPAENPGESFKSLINGIEVHNLKSFDCGFKLRTGGTEAKSFPSSEQIVFCIRECLDRKVQMKFTAGLHHPLRHYDSSIGAMMHGFLNVFGAGIISMRHDLSNEGMNELLDDENAEHFKFTDDSFEWNGWKVNIEDIDLARQDLVTSYGSCSFDEPIDDLKSLNFL